MTHLLALILSFFVASSDNTDPSKARKILPDGVVVIGLSAEVAKY